MPDICLCLFIPYLISFPPYQAGPQIVDVNALVFFEPFFAPISVQSYLHPGYSEIRQGNGVYLVPHRGNLHGAAAVICNADNRQVTIIDQVNHIIIAGVIPLSQPGIRPGIR